MHYYQFNIGDYASHTKGLSLLEDLAYRRLMDEYYLAERPLNGCSTDVQRIIGMAEYASEVDYILNRYFRIEDGFYVHDAIEKNISAYRIKSDKASAAGKASAKSRAYVKDSTGAQRTFNECSTDVQPTINHKPITNNNKKDKGPATAKAVAIHKPKCDLGLSILQGIEGLSQQVASDYLTVRKTKKAGALTSTQLSMIGKQAEKAGITLSQAIAFSAGQGWVGFNAKWFANEVGESDQQKTNAERTQDFRDKQAEKAFAPLLNANQETLLKWGLVKNDESAN